MFKSTPEVESCSKTNRRTLDIAVEDASEKTAIRTHVHDCAYGFRDDTMTMLDIGDHVPDEHEIRDITSSPA